MVSWLNDSARFISPTKTPEYLAAGKPVVSTPIRDVVYPYGQMGLVRIANDAREFVSAADELLHGEANRESWLATVDEFLAQMSWDETWARMSRLIDDVVATKTRTALLARAQNESRGVAA